jgi:predicted dinucleotide-binding enzyme
MSQIGVLGSGAVGETLANGFLKHGYEVMRGSREPAKLQGWREKAGKRAAVGTFAETARYGELLVLAVKGAAAEEALKACGVDALANKTVIDTTNPISANPPQNGVLGYFTDLNGSLMERLQRAAPRANFVKAFSCVGNALMVNPELSARPSMFICGNDEGAKARVRQILEQFGWDTEDLGKAEAARAIEPLCMLWCIPGFLRNEWTHAYKVVRK